MENKQEIEGLLMKYLLNETSEQEGNQVERWIQASRENKKHLDQILLIWEQSRNIVPTKDITEEDAWHRMKQRLHQDQTLQSAKRNRMITFAWVAAAAVVFFIFAGWGGYLRLQRFVQPNVSTLQVASAGDIIIDTLPDGSVVTVNKNSFLKFPSAFTGSTREVSLNGEAFFNVRPDKKRPFIIHANDLTVQVLGTSFNIRSVNGRSEVVVESGIVEVQKNQQAIRLLPREKTVTSWRDSSIRKSRVTDKLYNYYRSKEFICDATPLQQLVETLNQAYNAHIVIASDSLKQVQLTTVFKDESLDNIIDIICETFKIKADKDGSSIILH